MGAIEILAYAFTFHQCQCLLNRLSKGSATFFENNQDEFKALCVTLRATKFWGRSKDDRSGDKMSIWPPEITQKVNLYTG